MTFSLTELWIDRNGMGRLSCDQTSGLVHAEICEVCTWRLVLD